MYPFELSVHDCIVVPVTYAQGLDDAHVGVGPHEIPPLLLPLPAPLLLLLLPEHAAPAPVVTHTGAPDG